MVERLRLKKIGRVVVAVGIGLSVAVPGILKAQDKEKPNNSPKREFWEIKPGTRLNSRQETSSPILDESQIQPFYNYQEDSPIITGYKGIRLEGQRGDLQYLLGNFWRLEGDLESGETLRYGGLLTGQQLVRLVENLPDDFTPETLFFVDLQNNQQDVFIQGRIGEEEIYLKATALIDELDMPKVPTWAKMEEEGIVAWNPGTNLWGKALAVVF